MGPPCLSGWLPPIFTSAWHPTLRRFIPNPHSPPSDSSTGVTLSFPLCPFSCLAYNLCGFPQGPKTCLKIAAPNILHRVPRPLLLTEQDPDFLPDLPCPGQCVGALGFINHRMHSATITEEVMQGWRLWRTRNQPEAPGLLPQQGHPFRLNSCGTCFHISHPRVWNW